MEGFNYRSNGEYAVKYKSPAAKNKGEIELHDLYSGSKIDITSWTNEKIVDLISEIGASGRNISKEEFENLVK